MNETVSSLILERLSWIDDRLSNIAGDVQDLKVWGAALDEHVNSVSTGSAGLNVCMNRFEERLSRVERRLDLRDAS